MKCSFLVLAVLLPLSLFSQEKEPTYPHQDGIMVYTVEVEVDASPEQLRSRAETWFLSYFKHKKPEVLYSNGVFFQGVGYLKPPYFIGGESGNFDVCTEVKIEYTETGYRATFSNFKVKNQLWFRRGKVFFPDKEVFRKGKRKPVYRKHEIRKGTINAMKQVINDLKSSMR